MFVRVVRGRPSRRIALLVLVVVIAVAAVALVVVLQRSDEDTPGPRGCSGLPAAPTGAASDRPFVGSLVTAPATAGHESRAGLKMAMLELSWRRVEPAQDHVDLEYVAHVCRQLSRFRGAGMQVTLGLGMHFTPQWLLDRTNSRYVDQDGKQSAEADFVFNQANRELAADYIRRVDDMIGLANFWAVRVTSGGSSELFYPSGGDYWAFSAAARPASVGTNPLPDWLPAKEDDGPSVADRGRWARWYVGALTDVANWQIGLLHQRGFRGYIQVLTPGQGVRPSQAVTAVRSALPKGLLGRGVVWSWVYAGLRATDAVTAYVSSVGDGSGGDDMCRSDDRDVALDSGSVLNWSATRWISRLAREYKLSLAGEVPGYPQSESGRRRYASGDRDGLARIAYGQAEACGFLGLYWAHDDQLRADPSLLETVAELPGENPRPPAGA